MLNPEFKPGFLKFCRDGSNRFFLHRCYPELAPLLIFGDAFELSQAFHVHLVHFSLRVQSERDE